MNRKQSIRAGKWTAPMGYRRWRAGIAPWANVFVCMIVTLLAMNSGLAQAQAQDGQAGQENRDPLGLVDTWSVEQAQNITTTDCNTAPIIDPAQVEKIAPDFYLWDSWPLRNPDGSVALVDGYLIMYSLCAPTDVLPGERHGIAKICYSYSTDGVNWTFAGDVFPEGEAIGDRQWAGSAVYLDGKAYLLYTAVGDQDIDEAFEEAQQRVAIAESEIDTSGDEVNFVNWTRNEVVIEADGFFYQVQEQAEGIIYSFRDPWFFIDPRTGHWYILFEGNTGLYPAAESCPEAAGTDIGSGDYTSGSGYGGGGDDDITAANFNGSVGIAMSPTKDMFQWSILPAILEAQCVNQQLERPHIIYRDDRYYLFFLSHQFTFAPDLDGPDGLYGFVADELHGDYTPLNGGGLVVANPPEEPFQAYSWVALADGSILSYFNYFNLGGLNLQEVGEQPGEFQRERFGGTLAPTLRVEIDNTSTCLVEELAPGEIPLSGAQPVDDYQGGPGWDLPEGAAQPGEQDDGQDQDDQQDQNGQNGDEQYDG